MMTSHLHREIDILRRKFLGMAALVEEAVQLAVGALVERDTEAADHVIRSDEVIDQKEVEVEEDCLKILALHQPVAIDLRYVVAILKINNDLERIGDLAVNIAKRAKYLARHARIDLPVDLTGMCRQVNAMLRSSLDAMVNFDSAMAREVCEMDDKVDKYNRAMYDYIKASLLPGTQQAMQYVQLLTVSRILERIADQATNIAEDVIYLIEGQIVRHWRPEDVYITPEPSSAE